MLFPVNPHDLVTAYFHSHFSKVSAAEYFYRKQISVLSLLLLALGIIIFKCNCIAVSQLLLSKLFKTYFLPPV